MAPAYILYVLLVFAGLLLLPGMVLTRLIARGKYEDSFFAVSLGVGTGAVAYLSLLITGLIGLLFRFHLSFGLVAGISCAITICGIVGLRGVEGSFRFVKEVFVDRVKGNFSPLLLLFLALAAAAYLLSYDSTVFDQERCVSRAGVLPFYDYLSSEPPLGFPGCLDCFTNRNAFLLWNGGQRMGPGVFVANFMALFGFPGFRLVHVFFGLMTAWFGWHLGRTLFSGKGPAYLTAALLAFNPYALSIPLLDENIMSLAIGTALFYVIFAKRTQWVFAGLFLGLFLGIRHVGILSIPAVVVAAWCNTDREHYRAKWVADMFGTGKMANISILLLSTVLFSIPWILVHTQGYWAGREIYESFVSMPETPHSFLSMEFSFRGLLSWPFVDSPVRSPYNGFPTLVSFPLTIVHTWGIALLCLAPIGAAWAWRKRRAALLTGALWFSVQLAMLCVMANWVQPNKMGVFLCFSQPIALAIVAGLNSLVAHARKGRAPASAGQPAWLRISRRWSRPAGITAATAAVLVAFQLAAAGYEARLDERNFRARVDYILEDYPVVPPMVRETESAFALKDRKRLTRVALMPDFSLSRHMYVPHLLKIRLAQLRKDFAGPEFKDYCERPKDLIHGLFGITPPPNQQAGSGGVLDMRKGEFPTLDDMMHHPVSTIRDDAGGEWGGCFEQETGKDPLVAVTLDLSRPPVANDRFLSAAGRLGPDAGDGSSVFDVVDGTMLVASDIQVPWADGGPCHLAVIPVWSDYYWLVIWYGDFLFGHLPAREDVRLVEPVAPLKYRFRFPDNAVLRIAEVSSLEPTRFHVWTTAVDESCELFGPIPSSY